MMITEGYLVPCTAAEIAATDLSNTIAEESSVQFETYRAVSEQAAERGSVIYDPASGRGAIAWGGDAQWTDASSAEDVLNRWLRGEMVN